MRCGFVWLRNADALVRCSHGMYDGHRRHEYEKAWVAVGFESSVPGHWIEETLKGETGAHTELGIPKEAP